MKKNIAYKILFYILVSGITTFAQQEYIHTSYNISDGLVQSTVRSIYMDDAGFLWLGTDHGLSRYDGKEFKNFTKPERLFDYAIIEILQDRTGKLLLLTETGKVWQFDGFDFSEYSSINNETDVFVTSMSNLNNELVIGTRDHGVFVQDFSLFKQITKDQGLYSNNILRFNTDRMNNFHIVTSGGVNKFVDGEVQNLFKNDTLVYSNLIQHSKGSYWCTVDGQGVYRLEDDKWVRKQHTIISPYYQLKEDSLTNIWAAFEVILFRIVDNYYGEVYSFNELQMGATCVTVDKSNNVWIGTYGNGFKKITRNLFDNFVPLQNFPGFFARVLHEDKNNNIWISPAKVGIVKFGEQYKHYTTEHGLLDNNVNDVCEYKSEVLVASDSGIVVYKNERFYKFNKQTRPVPGKPRRMLVDSKNVLWAATRSDGVYRLIDGDWQKLDLKFSSGVETVNVIFEDSKKTLWFGTNEDGVFTFDGIDIKLLNRKNGIASNHIVTIAEDSENKIWLGTKKGITLVDNYSISGTFGVKDGLFSEIIYALTAYQDKMLVGTPDGFGVYSEGNFKFFSTADGMASNDVSSTKMIIDEYGKVFFGTNAGFSIFFIEWYLNKNKNYNIIFSEVICDEDTSVYNNLKPCTMDHSLEYPASSNLIRFKYSPVEYSDIPLSYRSKTTLNGVSGKWVLTQEPIVENYECSPGQYNFIFQAKAFGDEWQTIDEKNYSIAFPFYRTTAFYSSLLAALVFGGALFIFIQIRKEKLLAENKYKTSSLTKERSLELKNEIGSIVEKEELFKNPDLTLQMLSERINVSKEHISQVINSEFQQSFNDYVNRMRISEATCLLKINGKVGLQILQIAYEVGFNNKSSFNNAFKKFIGTTPTEYRKTHSIKSNA